jgi:hypothetical protein
MRRDVLARALARVLVQPVVDAVQRRHHPTGGAGDPLAGLGVDDEELEKAGDVGAFPVAVHIGFGDADGAAGEGPGGQLPVLQDHFGVRTGRLAGHQDLAAFGSGHAERAALQVHGRRQHQLRLGGEPPHDIGEILRVQPDRLVRRVACMVPGDAQRTTLLQPAPPGLSTSGSFTGRRRSAMVAEACGRRRRRAGAETRTLQP